MHSIYNVNSNEQDDFNDDFPVPFIDVLDRVKPGTPLTTDIALKDGKSITHAILPADHTHIFSGDSIEMIWVYGETLEESVSMGKKVVESPHSEMPFEVTLEMLTAATANGHQASLYYYYTPNGGPAQKIHGETADIDQRKFTVEVETTPSYDIYVTGACDHWQLAKKEQIHTLTNLDNRDHKWRSVTRGGCSHLAISDKGQLWGFGYNGTGALGTGDYVDPEAPTLCSFGENGSHPTNIVQATTAFYYSAALDSDGYLYVTGNHSYGCLGDNQGDVNTCNFAKLGERKYKYISASNMYQEGYRGYTLFAIGKDDDDEGCLYRCGWSDANCNVHLSDEANAPAITTMKKVDDGTLSEHKWLSVAQTKFMGAAINEDHEVYVWGNAWEGCLGNRDNSGKHYDPFKLSFNGETPKIKKVVLGGQHALALDMDGNVWGWGWNESHTLAQSDTGAIFEPFIISIANNEPCQDIAADLYQSAAVTTDGKLYVWGQSAYGNIGLPDGSIMLPTYVPFEEKIGAIQMGYWSTLALSTGEPVA
ncbi:hypothetical protein HQN64_23935 [Enterobacteriaceae bacterium BIT-l23]|uniref:RCC1 domain-containing protein n=1 Tax=Jejubacter sp. L23 TaxID=3092086 RepID=UPI0015846D1A|nr:hypothetical protein [Enterobacteriaceae bacterium BIT-l23]